MKCAWGLVTVSTILLAVFQDAAGQSGTPITTTTADGVTIHGQAYGMELGASAPLLLLFHQGRSSGRGEYEALVPWLVGAGYRAIAWDQRFGGDLHGHPNRTVVPDAAPSSGTPYCEAYPDLQAALDYVRREGLAASVIVWGSSYSGALAVQLAAKNPERVRGVLAFSPASGGPMADCRAEEWLGALAVPLAVFRPAREMEVPSALAQRDAMLAAGAEFVVVAHGVHGSSMLVDARTGSDMTSAREAVLAWLGGIARGAGSAR